MKVFVVGASGLVGGNCLKHFTEQGWETKGSHLNYVTRQTEYYNSLEEKDPSNFDIKKWQPDVIVHCGALTHVDHCETHPDESYTQTVQSTINIARLSNECGSRMVYLSTDYVFDGKNGPYIEADEVHPLSVYGKHKLEAEQHMLSDTKDALVLRVTNVYGDEERGKNFVARIVAQCKTGTPINLKLPYDQFASPTNAMDIAKAMFLLLRDEKQGIYHIGGTDYMNRVDLAQRVLKYYPQANYTLKAVDTASLAQPAPRPLRGGFIKMKFSAEYPEFLFSTVDDYMMATVKQ